MTTLPEAFRLDGRVAVVTGAASGIGRASAIRLAEAGARVVVADVDESGLAETQKLVEKAAGTAAVAVPTDVTDRAAVSRLVEEAVETCGRLDVMANVAGVMRNAELVDLTEEELDAILAVNLKGTFFGVQAALRAMRDTGEGGSIVNIGSGGIDFPAATYGAYTMSKAAVTMMTRTAAVEAGAFGVRVNTVAPGFVETGMTSRHFTDAEGTVDEDLRGVVLGEIAKRSPLRMTGTPDDVAHAVVYLAGDAARFVTGQIVRPNGGVVMPW